MKWFRTKSKATPGSERTAQYIVKAYRRVQAYWVNCMQGLHSIIPIRVLRWGYGLFFILGFSFCARTVYRAVFVPATPVLSIQHSQQGQFIGENGDKKLQRPTVSDADVERVKNIVKYFDSLQVSDSGKRRYDSIMRLRPGLTDSLSRLKLIYQLP